MADRTPEKRIGEWAARWADIKYTFYLMRKNRLVMVGSIIALFFVFLSLFSNYIVDPRLAGPLG